MDALCAAIGDTPGAEALVGGRGVVVSGQVLEALVAVFLGADPLAVVDTYTSGKITARRLVDDERVFVDERTAGDNKIVVRVLKSVAAWDAFVKDRQESYAMMWGSCCAGLPDYCEARL